jgi:hypothetical protein
MYDRHDLRWDGRRLRLRSCWRPLCPTLTGMACSDAGLRRSRHSQPDARQGCRTVDRACIVECSDAGANRIALIAPTHPSHRAAWATDGRVTKRG